MNVDQNIIYCKDDSVDDVKEYEQFSAIDDMDYFEREIEALGVELESGIITQYDHDIFIVTLQITRALQAVKNSNIGFRQPDRKFGESVLAYAQTRKRLSEKQILAVTPMLGRYALVLKKLGIDLSIKNTNLWAMAYFKASFSPELVYSLNRAVKSKTQESR